jgi:hypothetical protein
VKSYPPLFEKSTGESAVDCGKRHLEDAMRVLHHRLEQGSQLRALPLSLRQKEDLYRRAFDFLKNHNDGTFEKDNVSHIARLIAKMGKYGADLKEFLGVPPEDAQLLAALHDLGKSKVAEPLHGYLTSIFGHQDFVNLKVIPHELYSMVWIQTLGREIKLADEVNHLLMDQIANHNLGPNLASAQNRALWAKDPDGTPRHWWTFHWDQWAKRMTQAHPGLSTVYGYTISPLANALVLFDRVDGAEPQAWGKFLNQTWLAGGLDRSAEGIIKIIEGSLAAAHEQLLVLGPQLSQSFLPSKKSASLEDFAPFREALTLIEMNQKVIDRLNASNHPKHFDRFKLPHEATLLYESRDQRWFQIEVPIPGSKARKHLWNEGEWREIEEADTPFELLLGLLLKPV